MSTRNSPEPWCLNTTRSPARLICEDDEDTIALIYLTDPKTRKRDAKHEANALLMASSPRLARALRGMLSPNMIQGREDWPEVVEAFAALKEAQG